MIKKKIKYLFLGYGKKETNLIDFLRKKGIQVKHLNRKLKNKDLKDIDLIISFGYKKIINEKVLNKLQRPPLNLHISYLPFNRGSHPNFLSFEKLTAYLKSCPGLSSTNVILSSLRFKILKIFLTTSIFSI